MLFRSTADIERIVREVLTSLQAMPSGPRIAEAVQPDAGHSINGSVVSVDSLRNLPSGTKLITIQKSALVTPAARDWLREKGIAWTRGGMPTESKADQAPANSVIPNTANAVASLSDGVKKSVDSGPKRLFVTGSVLWFRGLEKQLCPKQTQVDGPQSDDASAIRSVATAIRAGHRTALAIVQAPHSSLWQAARDEALRPAMISQWSDVADALHEVPVNVLLVPANRWSLAGAANIARKFLEHTATRS